MTRWRIAAAYSSSRAWKRRYLGMLVEAASRYEATTDHFARMYEVLELQRNSMGHGVVWCHCSYIRQDL